MMMRPLTDTSFARNGIAGGARAFTDRWTDPSPNHATERASLLGYRRHRETHDFLIKIFTAALIGSVN